MGPPQFTFLTSNHLSPFTPNKIHYKHTKTMANPNLSLAIVLVCGLTMAHVCLAIIPDWQLTYLVPQNALRLELGLAPLIWNDTVALAARAYAKKRALDCALEHSRNPLYGENIATSPGVVPAARGVDSWVRERNSYDVKSDQCKRMCGHYKQIVWRKTTSMGCATEHCVNGGTFIVCNYYPPGNYRNQR